MKEPGSLMVVACRGRWGKGQPRATCDTYHVTKKQGSPSGQPGPKAPFHPRITSPRMKSFPVGIGALLLKTKTNRSGQQIFASWGRC